MAGTVLAHRRFSLIALVSLSISRLALGLWQLERVDAVAGWQEMLLQGLRVDFATLCWLWGVPAVFTLLLAGPMPSAVPGCSSSGSG